ncbi:histidine phosphatase family protein [Myceligenerans salitolerans]|uniref:Histidine phosphatase family protein n=1 Tax=Myceligenerans salitolerans TaxID=1230528 RepID=A0ABS3I6G1_9MICO|nr:histidine phosphatase family protein [Myceligenerans salitolerans]MBO0607667.1 histidine phosphatase family protein [Myceligenerans salitolerans]
MTAGTIVLLRHGRTAYNHTKRLQGQVDIPLDDVGRWQAEQGANALASSHTATKVVASDLQRAFDTATAYAKLVGVDVERDERMRERSFGEWEGLNSEEIAARWPAEHAEWRAGAEPVRAGAESRATVAERMTAGVLEHAAGLGAQDTLVVVSHGAAITLTLTLLLGQDPVTWRGISGLHNVHWSHLHAADPQGRPGWRLVAHNVGAGYPLDHWVAGPDWNLEPDVSGE